MSVAVVINVGVSLCVVAVLKLIMFVVVVVVLVVVLVEVVIVSCKHFVCPSVLLVSFVLTTIRVSFSWFTVLVGPLVL